jgi:phosphoribosylformylglycinamidine synthase II
MERAKIRIEVYYRIKDNRSDVLLHKLKKLGFELRSTQITDNYLINVDLSGEDAIRVAEIFAQPITQGYKINMAYYPVSFDYAIEIGFLPGVTDNVAHTSRESVEDLLKIKLDSENSVFTSTTYFLEGSIDREDAYKIGHELHNPLIQRMTVLSFGEYRERGGMGRDLPLVRISERLEADEVNLSVSEEELLKLGKDGIPNQDGTRRGPLALDMLAMNAISEYFHESEKRNPTDVELESIAQTWSEHCKHTIFAARIDEIDEGIFKAFIKEATQRIRREKGKDDFCVSVFSDNSGGIEFDDDYVVSDKVETHNSPSALDPFGGAITGIVGVNRDAIGFGMASKPIANRYGYCFASPFEEKPLYRERSEESRLMSPRRIMEGVIYGVNVGGNCSGIPTPQGFLYFDERYRGKPLVFVGTVGLIPRLVKGKSSVQKRAMDGDCIVMVGGRVGRDGIHGATFSSEALSSGSPATAVQIGDPITQKKLSDAIVKEAREMGLFNSITDNGAGGLSCSVAEMARESGGFEVELDKVPLKYPGLAPWQIWVSESQERMTLAVPEEKLEKFLSLMERRGVHATVIGRFDNSGRGVVTYQGEKVFDLDMHFLHEGLPKRILHTNYQREHHRHPDLPEIEDMTDLFCDMVGRLNTASFEFISVQYDHEVQASSTIKPLQGRGRINGNATVIRPVLDSMRGVALSQGVYPSYGDIDTYWMAACSIDTAIRNVISVGGTLNRLALLDNFCWCDSNNPERLGQLKEAARACYDYAVAYGTPFISGKDSMFNDFKGYDENFNEVMISVPPTLLISSIGIVEDVYRCQTIDFKFPGDVIYLVGMTDDELGGSEYLACRGEELSSEKFIGDTVPQVNAERNSAIYRAFEEALRRGLIASSISIERGGLGVAIAKSAMAGMLGCEIELLRIPVEKTLRNDTLLYSESQGRLLVSVAPSNCEEFEGLFSGLSASSLGRVSEGREVVIKGANADNIVRADVHRLMESYKGLFRGF